MKKDLLEEERILTIKHSLKAFILFALLLTAVFSCKRKEEGFVLVEEGAMEELYLADSIQEETHPKITGYFIKYNPESDGDIRLNLSNGKTYKAEDISGGDVAAILLLLEDPKAVFYPNTKSIVINK